MNKKMYLLISALIATGFLTGCSNSSGESTSNSGDSASSSESSSGTSETSTSESRFDPEDTSFEPVPTPIEPTISGYKSAYSQKVTGSLHNPGMGWITLEEQTQLGKMDLGHNGNIPEADNVGIQTSWDLIEKEEGVFDWSLIDETIEYWTKQGKRINLRICTDSLTLPEIYYGAPRWLYDMGVDSYSYDYNTSGDSRIIVTDVSDPTYKTYFKRFMQKLSEKYADNPAVDTIDIRGYGAYGEWHSGYPFETKAERISELKAIVDEYAKNFAKKNKTLFLSCSWSYQDSVQDGTNVNSRDWYKKENGYQLYLENSAFDYAMTEYENVGYRRDGLAGGGCTKYATDEKALFDLIRSGKHAVNCGEFYNGYDSYVEKKLGCDSPLEATDELLFKSRCNYSTVMGWLNNEVVRIVESGDEEVFNRGSTKMGYRFKVEESKFPEGVSVGETVEVYSKISNSGLGRFPYEGYKFGYALLNSNGGIVFKSFNNSFDLRQLLNGEIVNVYTKIRIPTSLMNGVYTLAAIIADETGEPAIRLAQVGNYDARVYPLGTIEVGNYTNEPVSLYDEVNFADLSTYKLSNSTHYEVTFEYTPSVDLKNYIMGDDNGFEVRLVNGSNEIVVCNWQDVSKTKALKTVSFAVPNSGDYHIKICGTGIYENKINISKVLINKKTGSLTDFENNYSLNSGNWVGRAGDNLELTEDYYHAINGSNVLEIKNDESHYAADVLYSRLEMKNDTAYHLSFDTKGSIVGGNGCYYYVKLQADGKDVDMVGEWYDRPDAPASNKTFSFVTPSTGSNFRLIFGVKNDGGYYVDNINLTEAAAGKLVTGQDHKCDNNVRPYDDSKGLGKIETFENRVLPDSSFSYGFSRWGYLTTKRDEVIEGNYSLSSYIEPITYYYQDGNNFYEFCYSNPKYIALEAGATYTVSFDYKKITDIKLVSDPSADGWCYMTVRSDKTKVSGNTVTFADGGTPINELTHFSEDIVIPANAGDKAYIIIGVYGKGTIILDNMMVVKK